MHNKIKTLFYSIILTAAASQLHAERLVAPSGLATDQDGNVYVLDQQNKHGAIYKYDKNGNRLSELTAGFRNNGIYDIAFGPLFGNIVFYDFGWKPMGKEC